MKGSILDYSVQNNEGYISGDDGQRYVFAGSEWKSGGAPARNQRVDFTLEGNRALAIFALSPAPSTDGKNKIVAGLLAIFLGSLGIHKFYIGANTAGIIMLLIGTVGWLLIAPPLILSVVALVEGIIYLTRSDEEFERVYAQGKKAWF